MWRTASSSCTQRGRGADVSRFCLTEHSPPLPLPSLKMGSVRSEENLQSSVEFILHEKRLLWDGESAEIGTCSCHTWKCTCTWNSFFFSFFNKSDWFVHVCSSEPSYILFYPKLFTVMFLIASSGK